MTGSAARRPPTAHLPIAASLLAVAASLLVVACDTGGIESKRGRGEVRMPPAPDGPPTPTSPDRLPPGELLEGDQEAFGLVLPRGMTLDRVFGSSAHASGPVDAGMLSAYIKRRVLVAHVQLVGAKFLFPKAEIRGVENKLFRIEVVAQSTGSLLIIRDITPQPRTEGLTEVERWKRAGLKPSGGLSDPNEMQ